MALKLPRLQRTVAIVDKAGLPVPAYQQWWQSVARAVEEIVNDLIVTALVRLGAVEIQADGTATLAESAINPGGTIKDDKVLTPSIIADGVTQRYFSQTLADIPLPDGVETDVASVSVTKVLGAESDIDVEATIRLKSSDDIRGTMKIYRGAVLIDSFDPYMNGAGGTFRISQTLPFTDSGVAAGTYNYKTTFTRNGGASAVTAAAGALVRAKEFKR